MYPILILKFPPSKISVLRNRDACKIKRINLKFMWTTYDAVEDTRSFEEVYPHNKIKAGALL